MWETALMRFRYPSTCGLLLQLVSRQLSAPNPQLSVAASSEDSYPKPELEHVPQGTACIIQGHVLLKQSFKSKPGF